MLQLSVLQLKAIGIANNVVIHLCLLLADNYPHKTVKPQVSSGVAAFTVVSQWNTKRQTNNSNGWFVQNWGQEFKGWRLLYFYMPNAN
jgi:hypothetical protein